LAPGIVVDILQYQGELVKEIEELQKRREQIIEEIGSIRTMRKGSVTEQFLKVPRKGQKEPVLRGPYFLYSRKEKGKTVGRRLGKEEADRYREQVKAFHKFQALGKEYAEISERLADMEGMLEVTDQKKKRRRRSSSSRTKK